MPKLGILHDYDLQANKEDSAQQQTCFVCGTSPMAFQWSDYSGEAMCTQCGCCYQLKWGTSKQRKEAKYPYLNMRKEWLPILKEYWKETHKFVCHGLMMGDSPGLAEFYEWVKKNHKEMLPNK